MPTGPDEPSGPSGGTYEAMGVVLPLRRRAPETTDAELVGQAVVGSRSAQAELYRRHVGMVTGLSHRLLGGSEVDDLVQDAFVAAFSSLASLREPQAFAKWLGSIVCLQARKRIRRRRLRRRFFLDRSDAIAADQFVSSDAPPDVAAELRTLYAILEDLPADVRIALVLRRVEGLTIPEIAAQTGRSPATVKRRLQDGEVLLSARLGRPLPSSAPSAPSEGGLHD